VDWVGSRSLLEPSPNIQTSQYYKEILIAYRSKVILNYNVHLNWLFGNKVALIIGRSFY